MGLGMLKPVSPQEAIQSATEDKKRACTSCFSALPEFLFYTRLENHNIHAFAEPVLFQKKDIH